MSINEKIKAINNKTKKNKAQYNLDRHNAKFFALSSGNVSNYEFLPRKYFLPEKDLLEKVGTMKRFKYSLLDKELKVQTDITKRQYHKLHNTYWFDKIINKEKPLL